MCKEKRRFLHWDVTSRTVLAEVKVGKERGIHCKTMSGAGPLRLHAHIGMDGIFVGLPVVHGKMR